MNIERWQLGRSQASRLLSAIMRDSGGQEPEDIAGGHCVWQRSMASPATRLSVGLR